MFLEKITWKQAEGYFKEKDIAIIPVGSTENHGSQLCLGTDFLIPRRLCEMMDERLNILIAPTVPFGVGDQHIVFLNGHGGNTPVLQRVALELDERHAMGAILNWWLLAGELDPRWKAAMAAARRPQPCWPLTRPVYIWNILCPLNRRI